jgi:hypothetical protein
MAISVLAILGYFAWFLIPKPLTDEFLHYLRNEHQLYFEPSESSEADLESRGAESDQVKVGQWIVACFKKQSTGAELPSYTQDLLSLPYQINRGGIPVGVFEARIAGLTVALSHQRYILASSASRTYHSLQFATFTTIAIGLLTTIMVSLSSTDLGKRTDYVGGSIRISALVLPAIGTAAAAVIAFYGPAQSYARTHQALGSLGELHRQVGNGILRLPCADATDTTLKELSAKFELWEDQYAAIMNSLSAGDAESHTETKNEKK